MFRVFFINFGWFSSEESETLEGALKVAKNAGFQSSVYGPGEKLVASWCPLSGTKIYGGEG